MVVTTPFFHELKKIFPGARTDVLCSPTNQSVLQGNPDIEHTPVLRSGLRGLLSLWCLRNHYELVIDLNHSIIWRDMLLIRFINPTWVASTYKRGKYGVRGSDLPMYRLMPPQDCQWTTSITGKYLNLVEHLGGKPNHKFVYRMFVKRKLSCAEHIGSLLGGAQGFWMVNQHGGRKKMCLRDENVKSVIDLIRRLDPVSPVMWATSPSTEAEVREKMQAWFPNDGKVLAYKPTQNAVDICMYMSRSRGLVTPDTSLVHMASALAIPMVVIFANERELYEQWKPPADAWQAHIFSKDPKSLDGYDGEELLMATKRLLSHVNDVDRHRN